MSGDSMSEYREQYGERAAEIQALRAAEIIACYRRDALALARRNDIIETIAVSLDGAPSGAAWPVRDAYRVLSALEAKGYAVVVRV